MPLIIIYPYIFLSFYCHVRQSKTIQYLYNSTSSNGKSSLHRIYKDEYSNDFAYAVIRLSKITARNEKGLTARGTASKCLYGPKQILPGPGPGVATPLSSSQMLLQLIILSLASIVSDYLNTVALNFVFQAVNH